MWDSINLIAQYMILEGGVWGLLSLIAITWVGFKEWRSFSEDKRKSKEIETKEKDISIAQIGFTAGDYAIIKERQKTIMKLSESNAEKLSNMEHEISEISNQIEIMIKTNIIKAEKINILSDQLQKLNGERVEELKDILSSYNKTMNDLSLTLHKIKFILEMKNGDE